MWDLTFQEDYEKFLSPVLGRVSLELMVNPSGQQLMNNLMVISLYSIYCEHWLLYMNKMLRMPISCWCWLTFVLNTILYQMVDDVSHDYCLAL